MMVEGKTETAFKQHLNGFLKQYLSQGTPMPKLDFKPSDGGVPTHDKLKRAVENYLNTKNHPADHVIWLTDVYVDKRNPGKGYWHTAAEAKAKAREWVGPEPRFHPHVALHDFEAWLLPYWDKIQKHAKTNRNVPSGSPETMNHNKPPSYHVNDAYKTGNAKRSYLKTRDASSILAGQDLMKAINACPELKAFVNTILKLSGGTTIP